MIHDQARPPGESNSFMLGSFCIGCLVAIGLLECLSYGFFLLSPSLGEFSRAEVRVFAANHLNRIVQFLPECAEYNPDLLYVLRPGTCRFKNWEYDTTWTINSRGLRDDEGSLEKPDIVVLGDSAAAGWGVEQHEAFPALLETALGKKVLNVAVPSYGTARELLLYEMLRLPPPELLILEFCDNDYRENREYRRRGFRFDEKAKGDYDFSIGLNRDGSGYRFGKFSMFTGIFARRLLNLEPGARQLLEKAEVETDTQARQAVEDLLAILKHHGLPNQNTRIIMFEACWSIPGSAPVFRELDAARTRDPAAFERLEVVNAMVDMMPEDYFYYDIHFRASGHRKVAERLAEVVRRVTRRRGGQ